MKEWLRGHGQSHWFWSSGPHAGRCDWLFKMLPSWTESCQQSCLIRAATTTWALGSDCTRGPSHALVCSRLDSLSLFFLLIDILKAFFFFFLGSIGKVNFVQYEGFNTLGRSEMHINVIIKSLIVNWTKCIRCQLFWIVQTCCAINENSPIPVCIFAQHIELSCRWRCRCKSRCSWSVSGLNLMKLVPELNIHNHSNWEMETKKEILLKVGEKLWSVSGSDVFVLPPVSLTFFIFFACGESKGEGRRGIPPIRKTFAFWLSEADLTAAENRDYHGWYSALFQVFVFQWYTFFLIVDKLWLEALLFHCCHHFLLLLSHSRILHLRNNSDNESSERVT